MRAWVNDALDGSDDQGDGGAPDSKRGGRRGRRGHHDRRRRRLLDAGDAAVPDMVVQITAGGDTACAVTRAGALYCWGPNAHGRRSTARPRTCGHPGRAHYDDVDRFYGYRRSRKCERRIWCTFARPRTTPPSGVGEETTPGNWAMASFTRLIPLMAGSICSTSTPLKESPGVTATFVARKWSHTCVPTASAYVCWGSNDYGQRAWPCVGHDG